MSKELKETNNPLEARLQKLLSRAQSTKASARIYPIYQQLQTQRFMTENASEGERWPALKKEYQKYKLKRYANFPGGGKKMLIGTGTLAGAVIGPGAPFEGTDHHRAIFMPYSMKIMVDTSGKNAEGKPFTYPQYVAEKRSFMTFSEASLEKMKDALKQYLVGE